MTSKPRVKKYRVRRSGAGTGRPARRPQTDAGQAEAGQAPRRLNQMEEAALAPSEDGFGSRPFPTAAEGRPEEKASQVGDPPTPKKETAAIRK